MGQRQDFHEILVHQYDFLGEPATPCVKYQPGASITLTYPAIVYKLSDIPSIFADNKPYHWDHRYEVQVIDRNPESKLRELLVQLPMCRFSNSFVVNNLHHYVFEIYY